MTRFIHTRTVTAKNGDVLDGAWVDETYLDTYIEKVKAFYAPTEVKVIIEWKKVEILDETGKN